MSTSHAEIPTASASRYLQQLCKHFAHKLPVTFDPAEGRIGFYDPALFEPKREVTFTGRIEGYEERKVDGYVYRFPRMAADVVYLWPVRERVRVVTRPSPWAWPWAW